MISGTLVAWAALAGDGTVHRVGRDGEEQAMVLRARRKGDEWQLDRAIRGAPLSTAGAALGQFQKESPTPAASPSPSAFRL